MADSEEAELSNNMTLHWSDDDDVTVKHLRDDHMILVLLLSSRG